MKRAVLKFGGSSVASIEKMKSIALKIIERVRNDEELVIVVSAMGKTTNELLQLAKTAAKNPNKREMDMLLSTGEQISISLLAMILNEKGCPAIALTGFQAGIKTVGLHTKNKISEIDITKVEKHLLEKKTVVVAGFQGLNDEGDITTLGRGGSDTTAVALAAKLGCMCEIYTDVDGIYGVDPRLYPQAKKLNYISYEEMKEMAHLGAKVMEPRSIEIGHRYHVPIYVALNNQMVSGTYITEGVSMESKSVTGLSVSEKVMMVTLNKIPNTISSVADIFILLANNEINVDMISQTIASDGSLSVAFTASADDLDAINNVIETITSLNPEIEVNQERHIVKVSVVGIGMRNQTGVAAELFRILSENKIAFKQVTTSEISISYTIDSSLKEKAVEVIAKAFNL